LIDRREHRPRRGFGANSLKADGKVVTTRSSKGRFAVKLFDPVMGGRRKESPAIKSTTADWMGLVKEAHSFVMVKTG
jgi:hypothetical protein